MVPLQRCSFKGSIPIVASVDKKTSYTLLTIIPYVKELKDLRYVSSNGKVFYTMFPLVMFQIALALLLGSDYSQGVRGLRQVC